MARDAPSKKKIPFPVNAVFAEYLDDYKRQIELPIQYEDLLRFNNSVPLYNTAGNDTLWETVYYAEYEQEELHKNLTGIYALLKTDGDMGVLEHLDVARVDFCTFGNTRPFRVRIINRLNDNYDHFYVKKADSSRIYGLELEHLLSPNRINYLVHESTLIEEHIPGVPGDDFMTQHLEESVFNQIRMAKEFVKFNERCFVRLLGDMRAYNFVVDITPDIEGSQYRIRAIDFDQQSYEGRKNFYLPKYFKENNPIIFLGIEHMDPQTMTQYQLEERSMIAARVKSEHDRFSRLMSIMCKDRISDQQKVARLKKELRQHHQTEVFEACETMGEIVLRNIELVLQKEFMQSSIKLEIQKD